MWANAVQARTAPPENVQVNKVSDRIGITPKGLSHTSIKEDAETIFATNSPGNFHRQGRSGKCLCFALHESTLILMNYQVLLTEHDDQPS